MNIYHYTLEPTILHYSSKLRKPGAIYGTPWIPRKPRRKPNDSRVVTTATTAGVTSPILAVTISNLIGSSNAGKTNDSLGAIRSLDILVCALPLNGSLVLEVEALLNTQDVYPILVDDHKGVLGF